jgi:hypothetical protein
VSDAARGQASLWQALGDLVHGADVASLRAHKVAAVAARLRRERGEPVPAELAADERGATVAMTLARSLLEQIRGLVDGPILVLKGPEVGRLYPGAARAFGDLDLLVPDADAVQRALLAAGWVEVHEPDWAPERHHLRTLQPPAGSLKVEVHRTPFLPRSAKPFALETVLERAVPARLGISGISAPSPVDHALVLAAHSWSHEPLRILRDLVDVAAVARLADERELAEAARRAGLARIWSTTRRAIASLFEAAPPTVPLRVWARHLPPLRERTVLEVHAARLLRPFWELPPHRAVLELRAPLGALVRPDPGVTWSEKLLRVRHAVLHPRARLSAQHRAASRRRR